MAQVRVASPGDAPPPLSGGPRIEGKYLLMSTEYKGSVVA